MSYAKANAERALFFHRVPPMLVTIERALSALNRVITGACMALSAAGVLLALVAVCYGVVMRYVFGTPTSWVDDIVSFMLVGIIMLATANTLRQGRHINVDILTANLGERGQRWAAAWASLSVAVFAIFLILNGWETVEFSRTLGMMTTGNVEIPIFWLQLLMPLGGVLLLLVALESLLKLVLGYPLPPTSGHHVEEE